MTAPRIEADPARVRHNARCLVERLSPHGVSVTAVTKAVCGHPDIARAMLAGGVAGLADSRIENIERLRRAGIRCPLTLIRTPMPGQVNRVVQHCNTSCNTEPETIRLLGRAAQRTGREHGIILMVEMGDRREGIMPADMEQIVRQVVAMPGIALKGIGANFACLSGPAPDAAAMAALSSLAGDLETACGLHLETVSGGNSANLPWALEARHPGRINNLRIGEAILLGVDPITGQPIDGLFTDAFTLVAEIIESGLKPAIAPFLTSTPVTDAPGIAPPRPHSRYSILALGRQDTDIAGLTPPPGISVSGATSDHLVVGTADRHLAAGAEITFLPDYSALMRAMGATDIPVVLPDSDARTRPDPRDLAEKCNRSDTNCVTVPARRESPLHAGYTYAGK